jgi:glutamine cyclotransferase
MTQAGIVVLLLAMFFGGGLAPTSAGLSGHASRHGLPGVDAVRSPRSIDAAAQGRSQGGAVAAPAVRTVAAYTFDLVATHTRTPDAFTQGLVFRDGRLYEGTGLHGESRLRETVLADGTQRIVRSRPLPDVAALPTKDRRAQAERLADLGYSSAEVRTRQAAATMFGEGIALVRDRIYQLTWTEGVCLVWNVHDWSRPVQTFQYDGEGWGLTYDGSTLIMSDGSPILQFRDPESFTLRRELLVTDPATGHPVPDLNELEFIKGKVFANLYGTRRLAVIDPQSGRVEAYVYLDGSGPDGAARGPSLLAPAEWAAHDERWEVLNGIAYDAVRDLLIVTGKRWPAVFEIRLRPMAPAPAYGR